MIRYALEQLWKCKENESLRRVFTELQGDGLH
jgi:hypothetical protein